MTAILLHLGHRSTRLDLGPFEEWVSGLVRTVEDLDAFREQVLAVELKAWAAEPLEGSEKTLVDRAAADASAQRGRLEARFERLRAELVTERERHLAIRASRDEP